MLVDSLFENACPDHAEEWTVLCANNDCYASQNNLISVIKIGFVVRCLCCGKLYDSSYFYHELKKVGIF